MSSMWAYAGEFLTEQWRVAVNFVLIAATQNAIAIMMQNIMQRKRRSQKPEIVYWTLKVLVQDLFLAIIMGGYMESHIGLYIFYIFLKGITSVTNFLILYYTYADGAVKTALCGMGAELASVSIGGISLFVIYRGDADLQQVAYLYPVSWRSLLFSAFCFAIFTVVYLVSGKYLKRLRDCQIKHKKFWMAFFVTYICITLAQAFFAYRVIVVGIYIINFLVAASAGAVLIFTFLRLYEKYRQEIYRENEFLKTCRKLMLLHMEAVRAQILRMETELKMIDDQMKEIREMELKKSGDKRIREYLLRLKESYGTLQAGTYSDDFMVDAVLYHYGRIFSEMGIQPEISFRTYRRYCLSEGDAAEILMNLLEAGVSENMHAEDKTKCFLRLQGGTVKNQVIFRMECRRGKYRWKKTGGISFGVLKHCIKRLGGHIRIIRNPQQIEINIALERGEKYGGTDRSVTICRNGDD